LSAQEQAEIEQSASKAAVEQLKQQLTTTVNAEVRTPAFVDNVVRELKKTETARLTPIVKAKILSELQTELEPKVRPEVVKKVTEEVNAQKDTVLKTLHTALVQKNKADLMPKMNAKLSESIPEALASAKFTADVKASQLELKEKLRQEMEDELRAPLERVSKAKIKEDEKQRREIIQLQVKAEKEKELTDMIRQRTTTESVQPAVEKAEEAKMKKALLAKCKSETKKDVDLHLGPTLKEVLKKKYEKGTLEEAMAFVKQTKENKIREELKSKMEESVKTLVATKLADARAKLKAEVVERLKKKLFQTSKAEAADQLRQDTQGMSAANAAAVELAKDKELKLQAEKDAEQQANVEMQSGLEKQLEDRLLQEEKAAALKNLEKQVQSKVEAEAHKISDKALEQKYEDDIEAMEIGKAHASDMASDHKEKNAPDVVDSAAATSELSTATAAMLSKKKEEADSVQSGMSKEEIDERAKNVNMNDLITNASTSNTSAIPEPEEKEDIKTNVTDAPETNSTLPSNTTNATEAVEPSLMLVEELA